MKKYFIVVKDANQDKTILRDIHYDMGNAYASFLQKVSLYLWNDNKGYLMELRENGKTIAAFGMKCKPGIY